MSAHAPRPLLRTQRASLELPTDEDHNLGTLPGYPDCPKTSPLFGAAAKHGALLLGSWGTEFHEKLEFQKNDLVIVKHRVNAFYSTPLEAILRAQNIQRLILTGCNQYDC